MGSTLQAPRNDKSRRLIVQLSLHYRNTIVELRSLLARSPDPFHCQIGRNADPESYLALSGARQMYRGGYARNYFGRKMKKNILSAKKLPI